MRASQYPAFSARGRFFLPIRGYEGEDLYDVEFGKVVFSPNKGL